MEGGRTERMQMGKWFNKEERAEELSPSDRAGASGSLAAGPGRAGGPGSPGAPGAGSRRGAPAGAVFWFCFQKHSGGLAATFKDLKIWKQALGKRSPEDSGREYGKCRVEGPSAVTAPSRSLSVPKGRTSGSRPARVAHLLLSFARCFHSRLIRISLISFTNRERP